MNLAQSISAELLKLKRTIAFKLIFIAPLTIVALTLFLASQAPHSTLHRNPNTDDWKALTRVNLQFWGLLMLPLYLSLQTALVAGLDHADNQWKALFARPVPRWTIYVSKLIVVAGMAVASGTTLALGLLAEGTLLRLYDPDLNFTFPGPVATVFTQTAQMTGLAFLPLTISHWVSLRWRSFAVAIGFGIVALVTGFAMLFSAGNYGTWPRYFPWALPMVVMAKHPPNIEIVLWLGAAAGLLTALVGCLDFCRREIT